MLDEQIFRLLKGQGTAKDKSKVSAWRAASSDNEGQYRLLAAILAQYSKFARSRVLPDAPSVAEIDARAKWSSIHASSPPPAHRRLNRFAAYAAAAAALVLVGVGLAKLANRDRGNFGADEFVTSTNERAAIQLRDGTVVRLGSESRLKLAPGRGQREVTLTGRAYFAVAKAHGRPFVIHTPSGEVTVRGTRFDLEARERDLRVVVIEGRVDVGLEQQPQSHAEVTAGLMYRAVDGKELSMVAVPDAQRFVEWTGNFLAFQSTPLSEAAVEIERKYGIRVEIEDTVLTRRVVTAWFADRPLADVVRVVCLAVAAQCTTDQDIVRISNADWISIPQ